MDRTVEGVFRVDTRLGFRADTDLYRVDMETLDLALVLETPKLALITAREFLVTTQLLSQVTV
tara:strand:- start:1144 stop:1332 length:189 start_codon:yes stop_codon:yes gene_type:complete